MKHRIAGLSILMLAVTFPAAAGDINSSIHIESGTVVDRDLSTLNGRIRIDDGATVHGDAETVNGSVTVGRNAQVESVSTVNGEIDIDEGSIVEGDVQAVNGTISMGAGSRARKVGTVNGSLSLDGVEVDTDVSTYNGDVKLRGGTTVGGDVRILESEHRSGHRDRTLHIYIEDGSTVRGDVIVEDKDVKVEVHMRGGSVAGEIRGAKVVEK